MWSLFLLYTHVKLMCFILPVPLQMTWTGSWGSCLRTSSLLQPKLTAADMAVGPGRRLLLAQSGLHHGLVRMPRKQAIHRLLLSLYVCCVCSGAESYGDVGSPRWTWPQRLSLLLWVGQPLSAPKPALKGCFVPASPCLLVCHHPLCHRGQQCPSVPSLLSCSTPNPSCGGSPRSPSPLAVLLCSLSLSPAGLGGHPAPNPAPWDSPSRTHQQVKLPGSLALA